MKSEESIFFSELKDNTENVKLEISLNNSINYSLNQNGIPIIDCISIINNSSKSLSHLKLIIFSNNNAFDKYEKIIDYVPENEILELDDIKLCIDNNYLVNITEKITSTLTIVLESENKILFNENRQVELLTFNQWSGLKSYPEMIASFITPNHPEINQLIYRASDYLNNWTGSPSFDAYQSKDYNRVINQIGAIYSAIQEKKIVYVETPASYEKTGQRIRLCDEVLNQKLGNCMDLTLLFASLLEAIGLNSILIVMNNHIFLGVWLEDKTFPEIVSYDKSILSKKIAEGVNEIIVLECTCLVKGPEYNFMQAKELGQQKLRDDIVCFIDVKRARETGVLPLPIRIETSSGWAIQDYSNEKKENDLSVNAPIYNNNKVIIDNTCFEKEYTKKEQWERKLLDLSLRNNLINLRYRSVVSIFSPSVEEIINSLLDGKKFTINPIPYEMNESVLNLQELFERDSRIDAYKEMITSEFKNCRLRTSLSENELNNKIKKLYRSSRQSIQENGANTLFVSFGLLKWYETERSNKPIYAPLILVPVELVKIVGGRDYTLRVRDEESQINITVLEKLKQDFGIIIEGLDPLPVIDNYIDVRRVFTIIRNSIMKQKNWDVIETTYLGIYSFSQFVMWNDIRHRYEDLESNKIVKSLIDGKLCWDAKPIIMEEKIEPDNLFTPVELDSSQLTALKSTMNGMSYVLHGPPGTGKSQTITAMISNLLANGKTVLFVAEKQAALEVVQRRLEDIGIGNFCLELHSNKSKKSDVLDQIDASLKAQKFLEPEEYNNKIKEIEKIKCELNKYSNALHKVRECGFSAFELIDLYEKYKDYEILDNKINIYNNIKRNDIEKHISELQKLISCAKLVGHPFSHPLSRINLSNYSLGLQKDVLEKANDYKNKISLYNEKYNDIIKLLNLSNDNSLSSVNKNNNIIFKYKECLKYPINWINKVDINNFINNVVCMCDYFITADNIKTEILKTWNDNFLQLDSQNLINRLNEINEKFVLVKFFEKNKFAKNLKIYSVNVFSKNNLEYELNRLQQYQNNISNGNNIFKHIGSDLGNLYYGENTNWPSIRQLALDALKSVNELDSLISSDLRINYSKNDIKDNVSDMNSTIISFVESKNRLYNLLEISEYDSNANWFEAENILLDNIDNCISELKEWCTWNSCAKDAINLGLESIVKEYKNGLEHEKIINVYLKNIYYELLADVIDNDEDLKTFHGTLFEEKIKLFKETENRLLDLTKKEIYYKLSKNVPNPVLEASKNSEIGVLKKAIQNHGRGISIRDLFSKVPNIIYRLCPCMLMSPISVAQYLDASTKKFDYVIFDEASQLTTCKAVGTLARGINAVIVGDPKQMPPTTFFMKTISDEENIDMEDQESILEDCLALNIPDSHLKWHYRSRHESLIAFSNREFYNSELYTFPSVSERESRVNMIHVNGRYERSGKRYNIIEAKAVVEEVKKIYNDPQKNSGSVGIVTFNILQQDLIEDLLNEEFLKDSELEKWAINSKEPLFVKNLENVQGDERDIILFSISYGPDENGNVYMNFGPLNKEGGWRRLNVAISRARLEMKIFTSLYPSDIDLSRTRSQGVKSLKNFLEYASNNKIKLTEKLLMNSVDNVSNISHKIIEFLKENGYECDECVGSSRYKIDIGIIDKNNKDKYILGILLDGNNYRNTHNTRDREIAQVKILKSLGWNIFRVWSVDWFYNSNKVCENILNVLQSIENNEVEEEITNDNDSSSNNYEMYYDASVYTQLNDSNSIIPKYSKTALDMIKVLPEFIYYIECKNQIKNRIEKIIEHEAPITLNLIAKRVYQSFDISRTTSKMCSYIERILDEGGYKYTCFIDEKVYWSNNQNPLDYHIFRQSDLSENKRDISEIPFIEITNAICYMLHVDISDDNDTLIRSVANVLGYSRLGNNIVTRLQEAIDECYSNNRITKDVADKWILTDNELEIQRQLWN